jgi:2-phosphosulfolactate phosphatase
MRCHVAFTPAEAAAAPLGIVVDLMRATSTIAQALASGYKRVLCCAEIEDARALREELGGEAITGGEREANRIEGFDAGASPREFQEPRAETLILSTTNGTRSIVTAAEACDEVVLGALLNLEAVASYARERGEDVVVLCAGYKGAFAIDDAYCAGRIVRLVRGERTDAAIAAALVAERFPNAIDGINARTYGPPGLEEDIAWVAQESVLEVVPRFARMVGPAAEIVAPPGGPGGE